MVGEAVNHPPLKPWKYGEDIGGWFAPDLQTKLAELIAKHDVKTVLEIGTCYGCSAIWFAQRVERVTCVDLFGDIAEHALTGTLDMFVRNLAAARVADRVHWLVGDSHDPMTLGYKMAVDLVYLDGDHTYKGAKQDIEMYGPMARKVLCGDDYDVDLPSVAGVIRAVDECVPGRETFGRFWWKEVV